MLSWTIHDPEIKDLTGSITVRDYEGREKFSLEFVYLNDRSMNYLWEPELVEEIKGPIGDRNCLFLTVFVKQDSYFSPTDIAFVQGRLQYEVGYDDVISGFAAFSGRLRAGVRGVGFLFIPESIDVHSPMKIYYDDDWTQFQVLTERQKEQMRKLKRKEKLDLEKKKSEIEKRIDEINRELNEKRRKRGKKFLSVEIKGALNGRRILRQVEPPLTEWAQREGKMPVVEVECVVLPSGRVAYTTVYHGSGLPQLDKHTSEYLMGWKFEPIAEEKIQRGTVSFHYGVPTEVLELEKERRDLDKKKREIEERIDEIDRALEKLRKLRETD